MVVHKGKKGKCVEVEKKKNHKEKIIIKRNTVAQWNTLHRSRAGHWNSFFVASVHRCAPVRTFLPIGKRHTSMTFLEGFRRKFPAGWPRPSTAQLLFYRPKIMQHQENYRLVIISTLRILATYLISINLQLTAVWLT